MRNYLLGVFDCLPRVIVLSGRTGVGKTEVIREQRQSLDLERHANHRGSAFGRHLSAQPSQINFENALAIDLLGRGSSIVVEDEGRFIGKLTLPLSLQRAMKSASVVLLEDDIENRVERIFREYIVDQIAQLESSKAGNPVTFLEQKYTSALASIGKRLGAVNHSRILRQMLDAFDRHQKGDGSDHRLWIGQLLVDYYDPMYDYQLEQKSACIVKTGNRKEIDEYLGSI